MVPAEGCEMRPVWIFRQAALPVVLASADGVLSSWSLSVVAGRPYNDRSQAPDLVDFIVWPFGFELGSVEKAPRASDEIWRLGAFGDSLRETGSAMPILPYLCGYRSKRVFVCVKEKTGCRVYLWGAICLGRCGAENVATSPQSGRNWWYL